MRNATSSITAKIAQQCVQRRWRPPSYLKGARCCTLESSPAVIQQCFHRGCSARFIGSILSSIAMREEQKQQESDLGIETDKFVLMMATEDLKKAAAAIKVAQALQRPLLIKKLVPQVATSFQIEKLHALPSNLKAFPDDAALGCQTFSDWLTLPRQYQRGRVTPKVTWGGLATIMSEKARQKGQFDRFLQDDLVGFRNESGFTSLSNLGELVWGADTQPRSRNVILTGAEIQGRVNKSDAHQDQHDNIMLVSTGSKIWALAALTEEEVKKGKKNGNKNTLKQSLGIDAIDRTKNTCTEHHEVVRSFDTVYMEPGDVLFNPAYIWHQVNSEPLTLAYSIMYGTGRGETDDCEEDEKPEGVVQDVERPKEVVEQAPAAQVGTRGEKSRK